MNSNPSSYELETKAADERRRLDSSFHELKDRVKEKLDVKRTAQDYARGHAAQGSGVAVILGLILGYGAAGMFTQH
jgi:ElaB/YqjD/DUF883 family membrane-anchored ribosome-binding protein